MNKTFKIIKIILLIVLIAWIILITIDYIRITYDLASHTTPLITLGQIDYEDNGRSGTRYIGLGYSVSYYTIGSIDNLCGKGTNIKLFNIIPIYAIEEQ